MKVVALRLSSSSKPMVVCVDFIFWDQEKRHSSPKPDIKRVTASWRVSKNDVIRFQHVDVLRQANDEVAPVFERPNGSFFESIYKIPLPVRLFLWKRVKVFHH